MAVPDIFDEIEEDLKRDRYAKLWARHGWVVVALAVALVAGTGGWQAWRWHTRTTAEAATKRLLEATRTQDSAAAQAALADAARDGGTGLRTLARLTEAARQARAGDTQAAIAAWDLVAADTSADSLYRDLATLLAAGATLDSADPSQLTGRLQPLAQPTNPWRHAAQEFLALLALRQGNRDAALAGFRALAADITAPNGIRERAGAMLATLGAAS